MHPLRSTLLAFACVTPCAAQSVPAVIQSATSPSGRYALTVTAPLGDPSPAGSGWVPLVYTLTDTVSGKTVWTRRQAATRFKGEPLALPLENAPWRLFVADDATALALAPDGSIADFQRPIRAGPRTPVLSKLFVDDRAREAQGMGWSAGLVSFSFIDIPPAEAGAGGASRLCLFVRTRWGEHLLFDARTCAHLAGGKPSPADQGHPAIAPAEAARLLDYALQQERAWCQATIAAAAVALPDVSELARKRDLELALLIAASFNLRDAIPDIRRIETAAAALAARPPGDAWLKLEEEGRNQMAAEMAKFQSGKGLAPGDIEKEIQAAQTRAEKYSVLAWETLVPAVHQTLRTLGESPRAGVGVRVYRRNPPYPPGSREAILAANLVPVDERLKALADVKPGGQLWAAFETLGSPDSRGGSISGGTYLYHFDTTEPFTLRITVRADNQYEIKSVEEIRPPLWREGNFKRTVINR